MKSNSTMVFSLSLFGLLPCLLGLASANKHFFETSKSESLTPHANCIVGNFPVEVTVNNTKLTLGEPKNQPEATQFLINILQGNPTPYMNSVMDGFQIIKGTYSIYGELCLPKHCVAKTLQILSHGDTLSSNYWNISPNQSYVDYMTAAGYATLAYDRLGIGRSDHPDSIQVVQYPIHVEILHQIVQMFRKGGYKDVPSFDKYISVGHSAGSTATSDLTSKYPKDFDAVSLQGISAVQTYIGLTDAALLLSIGAIDERTGKTLPNGYLTPAIAEGIQFSFYSYPNFPESSKPPFIYPSFPTPLPLPDSHSPSTVFRSQVATKQTNSVGELLTYNNIVAVSEEYSGPVDCVLGQHDFIFCGADCYNGGDQAAIFIKQYYPKAGKGSAHFIAPGSGHLVNAHLSAEQTYAHQLKFFKDNKL